MAIKGDLARLLLQINYYHSLENQEQMIPIEHLITFPHMRFTAPIRKALNTQIIRKILKMA